MLLCFRGGVAPAGACQNSRRQSILVGLCIALFGAGCFGQATVVRAVAGDATQPFNYRAAGKLQGLGVDAVRELERRAGVNFQVQELPFARAYMEGSTQPNVLLFTIARTAEREALFHWIACIAPRDVWLWRLKRRTDIVVNDMQQAGRYTIGVSNGDAAIPELERVGITPGHGLHVIHTRQSFDRMLRLDRIDLIPMLSSAEPWLSADADNPQEDMVPVIRLSNTGGYYLAMAKGSDPALVARLQTAFAAMRDDGSLLKMQKQWLPASALTH
jgi:polar amino acid transport system substrate-binding protein